MQSIEEKKGKTFANYADAFDYLISAGIALNVQAISNPKFPLIESSGKNLLKLYLNDVGILSGILYGSNIRAILDNQRSINLGSVYETAVASELIAHGHKLFYYDNRSKGEVDYLIDDYDSLSVVPIDVKSGKDYTVHSALNAKAKPFTCRFTILCFFRQEALNAADERKFTCSVFVSLYIYPPRTRF